MKLATLRLGNGESRCNWMLFFPPHAGLTANKCLSNSPTVLTFRLLKLFPLLLNLKTATWQILALVSGQSMIFIGLRSDHCIVSPGLETWMMWLWEWCQQLDDVLNTMVATFNSQTKFTQPNLANRTYQTKPTKLNLAKLNFSLIADIVKTLKKAKEVNPWVRCVVPLAMFFTFCQTFQKKCLHQKVDCFPLLALPANCLSHAEPVPLNCLVNFSLLAFANVTAG